MVPCFEVRNGADIVGPVSLDQIKRGRKAGRIPEGSHARRVTPWGPVDQVVKLSAPGGREEKPCFEVRHGSSLVGPVSLDQIRRGRGTGKIPEGSDARIVWPWWPVDELMAATESRLPSLFKETPKDERRWFILYGDSDPIGPLATDKVERALATGDLPAWAPICREGTKKWVQARAVTVFQRAIAHADGDDRAATAEYSARDGRRDQDVDQSATTAEFGETGRRRRR